MFGTSVSDQETYNKLAGQLNEVNGQKFLSIEPQLGSIRLDPKYKVDWIIQGGESGPKKRKFDLKWAESMKEQTEILEIPYFFKQIDKVQAIPKELLIREFPPMSLNLMDKVYKKEIRHYGVIEVQIIHHWEDHNGQEVCNVAPVENPDGWSFGDYAICCTNLIVADLIEY